jgi:hypothetical protein
MVKRIHTISGAIEIDSLGLLLSPTSITLPICGDHRFLAMPRVNALRQ